MTAAYVTIVGTMTGEDGTAQKVTIQGMSDVIAFRPGSPPPRPHPEPPLGIWGPTDPRPWNPIAGIPGIPGFEPPKPGDPPKESPLKPVVAWTPEHGWFVVYVPTGEHVAPSAA